ncbi:MAK10-like protein [Tanacetum coccineum]
MAADKNIVEPNKIDVVEPIKEVDGKEEVEDETDNEPVRCVKEELAGEKVEELVKIPRSQPVGYYLKHKINEKLIEGLIVDQGSDVNVMPLSIYNRLTNEKLVGTDIRFSLASHLYIYPFRIAEDVLIDVAGHVYPVDFVILDIKEDENKPFILGRPFLTMTKEMIRFDKGTITLKSGKNKINFFKRPESLCRVKKETKNDIDLVALTNTVSRLILEWEERIRLHQEKEMEFD